jgi:hypothetical protein
MNPDEIHFLQTAFAGSLRLAFSAVFIASVLAMIMAILLPSGSVEDLAYSEPGNTGEDGPDARDAREVEVSTHEII